ncbi:tRNA (adenosine(37)-N6)-dimethylallyltransferase MiaA [Paenalcaligenes sp. Me131]|uniref:tRNA (adenosine(37)-N6)-dimethylallyltransferase MiaA n=1 Tax=Paenalcaligenes sp. Me131 TaxID=3392636 RepID=UPI003D2D28E5
MSTDTSRLPVICLTGPTAAGKSASTLALAKRWPIEIIVMDSATIYQGMDIGTAKPSAEEQALVPHHLLDIRDPAQSYSAADFATDATQLIQEIWQRGRYPLLCGGTMLYYKALREGLNNLPSSNPEVRARLDEQAAQLGWPAMHQLLAEYDPITAARLAPNDSQRIQRAMEIYEISGKPMSAWLQEQERQKPSIPFHTLSLEPSDRAWLHAQIALRYRQMIDAGLLAEVQALYARPDLNPTLPSIRCVGYRQLWAHLDGECSQDDAIEKAIAATRQLAKRQLTWLRSDPQRLSMDCLNPHKAEVVVDAAAQVWPTA